MSTAYYIVLNVEDPGFDTFVNGKAIAKALERITKITQQLGLKDLEHYLDMDLSEFGGPELQGKWFPAEEGEKWVLTLKDFLERNPNSISKSNEIISDLEEYLAVFSKASEKEFLWHLELDI